MNLDVHVARAVLQGWKLDFAGSGRLLLQVGNQAALRSFVLGELPPATLEQAQCLLGDVGLIGNLNPENALEACHSSSSSRLRRLFTAQQQRLSLWEMGIYEEHTTEAEAIDEDFFGNFR